MASDKKRRSQKIPDAATRADAAFRQFIDATRILTQPQFTRADALNATGRTDAQLKNTLDRDLVRLHSQHNPGTGRRRMFTGGDILKVEVAHTMSAIGFPMKWSYLIADEIELRAQKRLIGLARERNFCLITYPMGDGDWARIAISDSMTEKLRLPVAYQILEVDRLIDEILAKLNALIADKPIPDFSIPNIVPEQSPYSPENDFFRKWHVDSEGRDVLVGLTFEETQWVQQHQESWLANRHDPEIRHHRRNSARFLDLIQRHELARLARIAPGAEPA